MSAASTFQLDPETAQLLREVQTEQVERLGQHALLWLAVVPEWTSGLVGLTGFPADRAVAEFVEDAVRAGLCERRFERDSRGRDQLHFSMPDSVRERLFADGMLGDSRDRRREVALDVGRRVRSAIEQGVEVAPSTKRWAELVGIDESDRSAGQWLVETVQAHVDHGDTASALAWLEAGKLLAAVSGGELVSAIPRGRRRVELEYRIREDERALRHLLRREEQIAPFRELLRGPDERWALHYVGLGGVGKTMLIRYLGSASGFARDERLTPFPVARVDFDHLSPLYPATRPGQLLRELADELDLFGTSLVQGRSRQTFVESETSTYERARPRSGASLDALDSDEFEGLIQAFGDYVATLPAPVVLVLDTCEELAKLHPIGPDVPSVEATFRILERVHDRVPSLRVVLAGRRLLASEGDGSWHVDPAALPRLTASLARRPYLALHELRGFTAGEVSAYLGRTRGLVPSPHSLSVILSGSLDPGAVPALLRPEDDEPRYTPFDVALYADWIAEAGELPEGSARGSRTDAYVGVRIVERLRDREVVAALPAAVLLSRFDAPMIAPALGRTPDTLAPLLTKLAEQEWIHVDYGDELSPTFYEVEPQLAPRLRGYLERGGSLPGVGAVDLLATSERLAAGLEALVTAGRPKELRVEYLDSALRLLPAERGARLWNLLEERVVADGEWGWARTVTSRLLGEGEAAGALDSPLRAAVRALQIAAVRHEDDLGLQAQELWDEVEGAAAHHPDDEGRERLRLRASLGRIASIRRNQEARPGDIAVLSDALEDPDAPPDAVVAAIAGIAEVALPGVVDSAAVARLARRLESRDPLLAAFSRSLHVRIAVLTGAAPEADLLDQHAPPGRTSQRWLDWVAPDCLDDRLRLERVRLWRFLQPTVDEPSIAGWRPSGGLDSIDGERLASAVLDLRLAHAPVAADELEALEVAAPYHHGLRARCLAHRHTPPLVIVLARAWLALGNATRALAVLDAHESQALAQRSGADLVDAIRRARLQLSRSMRLRLPARQSAARKADSDIVQSDAVELELAVEVLVNGVAPPELSAGPDLFFHASWRASTPSLREATRELEVLQWRATRASDAWMAAALALDALEAHQVAVALGAAVEPNPPEIPDWSALEDVANERRRGEWCGDVPGASDDWARPLLRALIMLPLPETVPELPSRLLSELAREEGEMVALRLPGDAITLFTLAASSAHGADDPVGAALAQFCMVEALARSELPAHREALAWALDGPTRDAYDRLRVAVPDLPRWDDIDDAAANNGGDWSGWISRLSTARAGPRTRGAAASPPPEPPAAAATGAAPRAPEVRGVLRRRWRWIVVAVIALSTFAVSPYWATFVGTIGISSVLAFGAYVALIALVAWAMIVGFAALPVVGRRWFTAAFAMNVTIRAAASPEEAELRATLRTQPGRRRLLSLFVYGFLARPLARVPLVGGLWRTEGHAVVTDSGTRAVVEGLVPTLPRLGRICSPGAIIARLQIDDELTGIDWETELGRILATRHRVGRAPARLSAWRLAEPHPKSTPPASDGPTVLSIVPAAWALFAERAWKQRELHPTVLDERAVDATFEQPDVLHLIGRPVLTSAGWQLRLDTDGDALAATSSAYEEAPRKQSLLAPRRLPLGRARLVVLQHEPASTATGDDREASSMRALAAAIAAAGAPAVLVVPRLDEPSAERAIAAIATVRSRRLNTRKLLGLAETVRQIAGSDPRSSGGVVLYAPTLSAHGREAP